MIGSSLALRERTRPRGWSDDNQTSIGFYCWYWFSWASVSRARRLMCVLAYMLERVYSHPYSYPYVCFFSIYAFSPSKLVFSWGERGGGVSRLVSLSVPAPLETSGETGSAAAWVRAQSGAWVAARWAAVSVLLSAPRSNEFV